MIEVFKPQRSPRSARTGAARRPSSPAARHLSPRATASTPGPSGQDRALTTHQGTAALPHTPAPVIAELGTELARGTGIRRRLHPRAPRQPHSAPRRSLPPCKPHPRPATRQPRAPVPEYKTSPDTTPSAIRRPRPALQSVARADHRRVGDGCSPARPARHRSAAGCTRGPGAASSAARRPSGAWRPRSSPPHSVTVRNCEASSLRSRLRIWTTPIDLQKNPWKRTTIHRAPNT